MRHTAQNKQRRGKTRDDRSLEAPSDADARNHQTTSRHPDPVGIATELKLARKRAGLSHSELHRATKISRTVLIGYAWRPVARAGLGTTLTVGIPGAGDRPATVVKKPFADPEKEIPKS